MAFLDNALRAGSANSKRIAAPTLLVAGGAGALGAAVLEASLGGRRFGHVRVLVKRGFTVAMNGLEAVVVDDFDAGDAPAKFATTNAPGVAPTSPIATTFDAARPIADIALVVFDRVRHANGRELAFVRPTPDQLPSIANWLFERGVRSLIVLMPHSAAALPDALKAGLANLDEQGTAAIGFVHLVFVRTAQQPSSSQAEKWLQRLADGVLAQMRVMVPAARQPVRALKIAQFVVELAARLPEGAAGTRVAPPELVWQASQMRDASPLVAAWLAAEDLPPIRAPKMRM